MQYIPNIIAFIHAHPVLEVIVNVLGLLWTVATAVCIATTKVTDEQLSKLPIRLAAFVRASRHFGQNTLPFLQEMWLVIRGAAAASTALLVFLVKVPLPIVAASMILSCGSVQSISASGSVSGSPNGDWGASVGVVINIARTLDADAGALVSSYPNLPPQEVATAQAAIRDGGASLQVAQDGIDTYERVKNASNQCKVIESVDEIISKRLHVLTLLQDFGVTIPPLVQSAIETIAMIADAAAPAITGACTTDGGVFSRHGTRLAMVRAALSRAHE